MQSPAIHVTSEIGRLKKVMLHRPGEELENLMLDDYFKETLESAQASFRRVNYILWSSKR